MSQNGEEMGPTGHPNRPNILKFSSLYRVHIITEMFLIISVLASFILPKITLSCYVAAQSADEIE